MNFGDNQMKKIYKKIIIAIFLIYFVVTLISQQKTLNQYKSEASTYSEQLETAKETNSELQKTKEKVSASSLQIQVTIILVPVRQRLFKGVAETVARSGQFFSADIRRDLQLSHPCRTDAHRRA